MKKKVPIVKNTLVPEVIPNIESWKKKTTTLQRKLSMEINNIKYEKTRFKDGSTCQKG